MSRLLAGPKEGDPHLLPPEDSSLESQDELLLTLAVSVIRIPPSWPLTIRSLPASLLLVSCAVGFCVLVSLAVLTLIPLVVMLAGLAVGGVATILLGWAGIEALASFERWMERDPRFQR